MKKKETEKDSILVQKVVQSEIERKGREIEKELLGDEEMKNYKKFKKKKKSKDKHREKDSK